MLKDVKKKKHKNPYTPWSRDFKIVNRNEPTANRSSVLNENFKEISLGNKIKK